ncbi:stage II sporulation protein M [Alicyclobacillus suci]|uniref:stage II sporulation protein M n=1 Tax=Alicyclobacillus suci TaxID=2816080 RepID=UPI001A8F05A8|nr:stage II sporulation protein M [Alicyclobacillus suci]
MQKPTLAYRSEMRIYVALVIVLLVLGFLVGWLNPADIKNQIAPMMKELVRSVDSGGSLSWVQEFWRIFLHNAATELSIFGLVFGIFPAYSMWINGLLSGYAVSLVVSEQGVPAWKTIVFGLLPHGVIELAAIVWAAALGIANGMAVIRAIARAFRRRLETAGNRVDSAVNVQSPRRPLLFALLRTACSLPFIWGMLVIAALIESAITPHLLHWGIPNLKHH